MDHWHSITVRAAAPDAVQQWALLEARSPLMREELVRRYAPRKVKRTRPLSNVAVYCEIAAIALKASWCIYGS
jgi:hypothetical protein